MLNTFKLESLGSFTDRGTHMKQGTGVHLKNYLSP